MSTAQKLELVKELGASGTLYENEKRRIFGLHPLPELVGKRLQSLNYIDVDIAPTYQVQGKANEEGTENEQETPNAPGA